MAHDLFYNALTGNYSMFVSGDTAWHKLGKNVIDAQTWNDAMRLAEMNVRLMDAPLYLNFSQSGLHKVESHKALVWTDNKQTAAVVGKDFCTVQPEEMFGFCDSLVESHNAHYVSAGFLGETRNKAWVLLRVPSADISIADDKSLGYLLFAQGFDGSMALTAKLTSTRVVCDNTLTQAISAGGFALKVKHTSGAKDRLAQASKLLSGIAQNAKSLEEKLRLLASRKLTKDTYLAILDRVFPKNDNTEKQTRRNNILDKVTALFESNDKNTFPEQRGTAYSLLNAITNFADHEKSAKANGHSVEFKRAESAIFGTGAQLKQEAFDVILRMTDGSEVIETRYRDVPKTPEDNLNDILTASTGV